MNVVLDSPLEALAFNYVSFGILAFVNNLWPLVAVITAAVSFWRIRAAAGISTTEKKLVREDHETSSSPPRPPCVAHVEELSAMEEEPSTSSNSLAVPAVTSPSECYDGVTKGRRFVLYYDDDEGDITAAEEEEEGGDQSGRGGTEEWWGSWERVLTTRTGEMGWYRNQDLAVINGNVVRLWGKCSGGMVRVGAAQSVLYGTWDS